MTMTDTMDPNPQRVLDLAREHAPALAQWLRDEIAAGRPPVDLIGVIMVSPSEDEVLVGFGPRNKVLDDVRSHYPDATELVEALGRPTMDGWFRVLVATPFENAAIQVPLSPMTQGGDA